MAQFTVSKLNDNNQWQVLGVFDTYEEADDAIDSYTDKFPFAYVDIIEPV